MKIYTVTELIQALQKLSEEQQELPVVFEPGLDGGNNYFVGTEIQEDVEVQVALNDGCGEILVTLSQAVVIV